MIGFVLLFLWLIGLYALIYAMLNKGIGWLLLFIGYLVISVAALVQSVKHLEYQRYADAQAACAQQGKEVMSRRGDRSQLHLFCGGVDGAIYDIHEQKGPASPK